MPSHVFKIEQGKFGLSTTDPGGVDPCAASLSAYTDFTCQITSGALSASPNVSTDTVPATWCEPEQTTPTVGATSYSLDLSFLQDPDVVAGLSRFLFEHDTESAWFYMGLDGDNPPKAIGKVRIVSGTIGGDGRTTLTASLSLPVDGKPAVCFGNASGSEAVGGLITAAVGATITDATITGTTAGDIAKVTAKYAPSPRTAWTTGEKVTIGGNDFHWSGSAWAAGAAS